MEEPGGMPLLLATLNFLYSLEQRCATCSLQCRIVWPEIDAATDYSYFAKIDFQKKKGLNFFLKGNTQKYLVS